MKQTSNTVNPILGEEKQSNALEYSTSITLDAAWLQSCDEITTAKFEAHGRLHMYPILPSQRVSESSFLSLPYYLTQYQQPTMRHQLQVVSVLREDIAKGPAIPVLVKENRMDATGTSSSNVATVPNLKKSALKT
jgi:hypothetical protein